jgi:K+-dependent Na+/Ca+ exchanger-like protein
MSDPLTIALCTLALLLSFYALHRVTDSYFVQSLEILSTRLGLTSDIAGASLMAMGSSAPELFTSLLALVKGVNLADLGAGTIVGSAIFNILVIVGASALFGTAVLSWQPATRDMVFYILTIVLLYAVFYDGQITLAESVVMVVFYFAYLAALPLWRRLFPYADQADQIAHVTTEPELTSLKETPWYWLWALPIDLGLRRLLPDLERHPGRYLWVFLGSIAVIALLSWVLVEAGVVLAVTLGVPEAIIGLTVLAVGTSVPDLLSSMIVARQGKPDMAVSNAVGSNIFDILVGLGMVWMLVILVRGGTIPIGLVNLHSSVALLLATVVALLFILLVQRWRLGRRAGLALIALYVLYVIAAATGNI